MLSKMPAAPIEMASELPPKLIKGNGTPVKGTSFVITAMLMSA